MAALCELISAGLIEKDTNGDVLWTWSYPSVSQEDREFYLQKSQIASSTDHYVQYLYSQWKKKWYYIYTCDVQNGDNLPKVTQFSLVLVTKDFNPEKYDALCKILTKRYRKSGNPSYMLESYLSVITRGTCSTEENGKFFVRDFERNKALGNCHIKDVIESLGVETIILYTALLLKKRIVVYYPQNQMSSLLNCVRSLPSLVWHRQNWEIIYPYLELNQAELDELKLNSSYVAGFCDASVEGRMQSATLEELTRERGQAPYNKKTLKVVVISTDSVRCYKNDQGQEKKSMNVAVGDKTMAIKCVIYDEQKFSKFKSGSTLILKNVIKKTDAVVITSASKVFPTTKLEIPNSIINAGKLIINPPPAEMKPLDEALKSPLKTRVSVMGQIIQEEASQEVNVHNDKVAVKTIYLKDQTVQKCRVSLWREISEADIRPGDHISLTNVVLNVYRGESSLSTTSLMKLQKCEAPETVQTITVIGCSVEDLEVSFLLIDGADVTVPLDIVKGTLIQRMTWKTTSLNNVRQGLI